MKPSTTSLLLFLFSVVNSAQLPSTQISENDENGLIYEMNSKDTQLNGIKPSGFYIDKRESGEGKVEEFVLKVGEENSGTDTDTNTDTDTDTNTDTDATEFKTDSDKSDHSSEDEAEAEDDKIASKKSANLMRLATKKSAPILKSTTAKKSILKSASKASRKSVNFAEKDSEEFYGDEDYEDEQYYGEVGSGYNHQQPMMMQHHQQQHCPIQHQQQQQHCPIQHQQQQCPINNAAQFSSGYSYHRTQQYELTPLNENQPPRFSTGYSNPHHSVPQNDLAGIHLSFCNSATLGLIANIYMIGLKYPRHANSLERKKIATYLNSLVETFPCEREKNVIKQILTTYPPIYTDRKNFNKWTVQVSKKILMDLKCPVGLSMNNILTKKH